MHISDMSLKTGERQTSHGDGIPGHEASRHQHLHQPFLLWTESGAEEAPFHQYVGDKVTCMEHSRSQKGLAFIPLNVHLKNNCSRINNGEYIRQCHGWNGDSIDLKIGILKCSVINHSLSSWVEVKIW